MPDTPCPPPGGRPVHGHRTEVRQSRQKPPDLEGIQEEREEGPSIVTKDEGPTREEQEDQEQIEEEEEMEEEEEEDNDSSTEESSTEANDPEDSDFKGPESSWGSGSE